MRHFLLLVPLLSAAPAAAQDIVVTGRGLSDRPGDRAFDTVTIAADRIAASASARLENVLADVAGLQQFRRSDSRSANPTSQGISLRGIGGNASSRALLVLDGVPQADPFGGWVAFPAYATDRIARIRVTRGGGSGYLGPGALAGTVELDSDTPTAAAPLRASLAYGSRESTDARASAALVRGAGVATLSAAYARGDGFIPTVAEDRGPADRAAPYEQASVALRTIVALGTTAELQANAAAFTDTRDRGTAFTRNRSQGADASLRLVGRGAWGWSALAYLQTRAFASQFAGVDAARTTATQTLDQYSTPATGLGARLEMAPPVGAGNDLRLGADVRALSGRTQEFYTFVTARPTRRRMAGGDTRTTGVFADASITRGAWVATLGGRVDRWQITRGMLFEAPLAGGAALTDTRFPDRSGTQATGRAGLAWSPASVLTLRAAGYRGWRLPTLNELYRPFRVGPDATAANAALSPERLTGVDAGVTLTPRAGFSLSAGVFRNHLAGAIANVTAGTGPGTFPGVGFVAGTYRVRRNLDAIRSSGVEVEARGTIGAITALASWSHVDPRVAAAGPAAALDGLRPAQTPLDQLSATLGWRDGERSLSATLRHVARQFEDDANTRTLAPATTLDTALAFPLTATLALEARAENLFDTRVEAGISGADVIERATPRTVWLGLRFRGG
ncbi:MAG: TonB-dependent receptor [Sphingomonas adhaesiva]|uniref:TonB-dependent receptor n=1 Tax=Sphingomonas adhaesiva TaxID=28212 RepID=UPI002FFC8657